MAASVQIGDKAMYTMKTDDLKYPQPVPRGSAACFNKPPPTAITKTALQNFVNATENIETKVDDEALERKDVVLEMEQASTGDAEQSSENLCPDASKEVEIETSVDSAKSNKSSANICDASSTDADCKMEDETSQGENQVVPDTGGLDVGSNQNSTDVGVDQDETGNEHSHASGLAKDEVAVCNKPQELDSSSENREQVKISDNKDGASGMEDDTDAKVSSELEKLSESKILEQCKEFEAVQNKTEKLHSRAAVLKTDLSRDVDLLSALHSDLCEASESIVKIADSFKPLLQRASTESAKEISGHVTRLLESRERLNEQINLTEGLLKGGKKTIGVLQHLADNRKGKSGKSKDRKEENADSSSDEYISDDEDDAGSHTGSIGSIGSNASGKGSRSRPKMVSSKLMRHNRNQQPRLLSRKRPPPRPLEVGERVCTEVTHTWTLVDVMWQVRRNKDVS